MPELEGNKSPNQSSEPATTAAPAAPPTTSPDDVYDLTPEADAAVPSTSPATAPAGPPPGLPAPPGEGPSSTLDRGADGRFLPRSHRHPQALADDAADFGMSAEEIARTDTETLAMTLRYMRRAAGKDATRAQVLDQARDQAVEQQADRTSVTQDPANPPAAESFDLPLDEATYDPKIVSLAKAVRKLLAGHKEVSQYVQSQQAQQTFSELDKGFADLGDSFEPIFGKGAGADMRRTDPPMKSRMLVVNSLRADPIKGATIRKAVVQRAKELFGHLVKTAPAPGEPQPQGNGAPRYTADEWAEGGLASPTARGGAAEPDGPAKATKNLRKKMSELHTEPAAPVSADEFL